MIKYYCTEEDCGAFRFSQYGDVVACFTLVRSTRMFVFDLVPLWSVRSGSVTATQQESFCPLRTVARSPLRSPLQTGGSPGEPSSRRRRRLLWAFLRPALSAPSAPRATTASLKNSTTSNPSSARRARRPNAYRTAVYWSPPL